MGVWWRWVQEGRAEQLQRLHPSYLLTSHRVLLRDEPTLSGGRLSGQHGHCDGAC